MLPCYSQHVLPLASIVTSGPTLFHVHVFHTVFQTCFPPPVLDAWLLLAGERCSNRCVGLDDDPDRCANRLGSPFGRL